MNPDFLTMLMGALGQGGQGPLAAGGAPGGAPTLPGALGSAAAMGTPQTNPLQSILMQLFHGGFGGAPPPPQPQPVATAGPAGTPATPVVDPNQPTPQQMGMKPSTGPAQQRPFRFGSGGGRPGGFGGLFSGGSGF